MNVAAYLVKILEEEGLENMRTIIDLFERSCEKFPDNPYLWEKKNGKFAATSYMETSFN